MRFLILIAVAICGFAAVLSQTSNPRKKTSRAEADEAADNCVCVKFDQCNLNNTLDRYGTNVIDIRRRKVTCPHILQKCCRNDKVTPGAATVIPPATTPPTITNHQSSIDQSLPPSTGGQPQPPSTGGQPQPPSTVDQPRPPSTVDLPQPSSTESPILTGETSPQAPRPITRDSYKTRGCGYRNKHGVGFRIIGGTKETQFGEYPWMIALLGENNTYICGGSLIHPKVVLTGAHCVSERFAGHLTARAGDWDRSATFESLPHQDRKIDEVIVHEYFLRAGLLNDIALLILNKPMTLDHNVDTVCLPSQNHNFDLAQCLSCGWGKMKIDASQPEDILKSVELPVVPKDVCEATLRKTRLGEYFELHESLMCAGGKKGQDTCDGDGGSPLMCPLADNSQRYQQAGIVAWGIGCGNDLPAAYVSVSAFREWIDSQLRERGVTLPSW